MRRRSCFTCAPHARNSFRCPAALVTMHTLTRRAASTCAACDAGTYSTGIGGTPNNTRKTRGKTGGGRHRETERHGVRVGYRHRQTEGRAAEGETDTARSTDRDRRQRLQDQRELHHIQMAKCVRLRLHARTKPAVNMLLQKHANIRSNRATSGGVPTMSGRQR